MTPKGQSEAGHRRKTVNTITKRKRKINDSHNITKKIKDRAT